MKDTMKFDGQTVKRGFTLIEIIIVVIILSIAAVIAIPTVSNAADIQVRAAANRIAADIDYARNIAITYQRAYSVVFDLAGESYRVQDDAGAVIDHPVNPGVFEVNFGADSNLSRVDIQDADFDSNSDHAITFDYLGNPYSGLDTTVPLNIGQITLRSDNFTLAVNVEPVTGYVTITGL